MTQCESVEEAAYKALVELGHEAKAPSTWKQAWEAAEAKREAAQTKPSSSVAEPAQYLDLRHDAYVVCVIYTVGWMIVLE